MGKIGTEAEMPPIRVTGRVHEWLTDEQSVMWQRLGRKPTYCEVIESLIAEHDRNAREEAGA